MQTTAVLLPLASDAQGATVVASIGVTLVAVNTEGPPTVGWVGVTPLSQRQTYITGEGTTPAPVMIHLVPQSLIATPTGTQTYYWIEITTAAGARDAFPIQVPVSEAVQDLTTLRGYLSIPAGSIEADTLAAVIDAAAAAAGSASAAHGSADAAAQSAANALAAAIGATGPQGPKGDPGATGPQGPKGDPGATGRDGSDASVTSGNIATALGYTPEPAQTAATQAEVEAGIVAAIRSLSPVRLWQSVAAWFAGQATLLGRAGGRTIIGGTGVADALTLQGTSGNGTATADAIKMTVGNNGASVALSITNGGTTKAGQISFGQSVAPYEKILFYDNNVADNAYNAGIGSSGGITGAISRVRLFASYGNGFEFLTGGRRGTTLLYMDVGGRVGIPSGGLDIKGAGTTTGISLQTQDSGGNVRLSVTDSGKLTAAQFFVSSLNTAPASSSDTGIAGEIRFTSSGIYFCTATNTWLKFTGATF